MSTTAFLRDLRAKGACPEGYAWARRNKATGFADAWARLPRADWMLWLASAFEVELDVELLRQFAFACADRAVRIHAVAALRSAGLDAEAEKLAALPAILDATTAAAAGAAAGDAARAARDAAGAAWAARAAGDAARAAEQSWGADRLRATFPDQRSQEKPEGARDV